MAYFFIDRKGRRWLLMLSLAAMFPLLLATAWSFRADGTLQQGLVATFLILYTIVSLRFPFESWRCCNNWLIIDLLRPIAQV